MKTASPAYLLPGSFCIHLHLHQGTPTKFKGILYPLFTILMMIQTRNALLWSVPVGNVKYIFLTSQLMDCMTKLQSLNTRNIELGEPEPGDLADNQAVTDSFLGTGRGQKHSRAISQYKHSAQFEIF